MKLCYFYTDITLKGGIERVLSNLTSIQVLDPNLDITIVSQYKTYQCPNYPFNENLKCVYLQESTYGTSPGSIWRVFAQLRNRKKINSFFKENKFDIIASQAFPNTFMLYLSNVKLDNVIAVEHVFWGYYNSFIRLIRNYIYKKVRNVVVLTERDKNYFDKYLNNVYVIPNPINFPMHIKYSTLKEKKIISIGRLEYQKGYDILIDVFARVHSQYPDWTLEIWGEGSLKNELQSCIDKAGLHDFFILKGTTSNIEEKIQYSSIFVMSSRFEGFGMVLIEAMLQGVPCISFDCPNGPSDIITHNKDGLLVNNGDIGGLEKALMRLIEDCSLRSYLSKNAIGKVKIFDSTLIKKQWDSLYGW